MQFGTVISTVSGSMENVAFTGVGVKTVDASQARDPVRNKDLLTEMVQEGASFDQTTRKNCTSLTMMERAPNHSRHFAKITSTLSLICIQRLSMLQMAIFSLKLSRKNLEISI
jgi:ureidoglycolate hydrolase